LRRSGHSIKALLFTQGRMPNKW